MASLKRPGVRTTLYSPLTMWFWVIGVTFIRVMYLWINDRPLGIEEAQYWSWSTHLAWGYHSKGPMIAWLIHLSTWLNSNDLFGVRFVSPLSYAVSTFMIYFSAKRMYNPKVAFYASIIFLLMPGVSFSATIISTDPIMIMFWAIAFYNLVEAIHTNQWRHWVLCGVAIGLGLLSKYTMVVFAMSALLYLLFCDRDYFKNPRLYLCAVIALVIFAPNLYWNATHEWVTFSHVSQHNADLSAAGFHLTSLFNFIGSQFAVAGPITFALFLWYYFRPSFCYDDKRAQLLFWQVTPLFAGIVLESILSRAYANWAAPIYVAVSIFICACWLRRHRVTLLWAAIILNMLLAVGFGGLELGRQMGYHTVHSLKVDPFKRNRPWPDLGDALINIQLYDWDGMFLFDDRAILSESLYYGHIPRAKAYVYNPSGRLASQYDMTTHLKKGQSFYYVTSSKDGHTALFSSFASHSLYSEISIFDGKNRHSFYIYDVKDFKGYQ